MEIRCECLQDTLAVSWVSCSLFPEKQRIVHMQGARSQWLLQRRRLVYKVAYQYILCMFDERRNALPSGTETSERPSDSCISNSHVTSSLGFTLIRARLSRGWTFRCVADGPSFRPLVVYSPICLRTHDTASCNHMAKTKTRNNVEQEVSTSQKLA